MLNWSSLFKMIDFERHNWYFKLLFQTGVSSFLFLFGFSVFKPWIFYCLWHLMTQRWKYRHAVSASGEISSARPLRTGGVGFTRCCPCHGSCQRERRSVGRGTAGVVSSDRVSQSGFCVDTADSEISGVLLRRVFSPEDKRSCVRCTVVLSCSASSYYTGTKPVSLSFFPCTLIFPSSQHY